jgi:Ca2+-binding RTX toxin-like protein
MSFHLWQINEVFSNADGTLQYIELRVASNGENFLQGNDISVNQGGTTHTLSFDHNLSSSATANKKFLIATQAFATASGITPDYIIDPGFLFLNGGTINFAGVDGFTYSSLPSDGETALYDTGATNLATPMNFAGVGASDPTGSAPDAGNNTVSGGTANDTISGLAGDDSIVGAEGNDRLQGNQGNDTLRGGLGDDELRGGQDADVIYSGQGNDQVFGALGNDELRGGLGNDTISAGQGNDSLFGGADSDFLQPRLGNDTVTGGAGGDIFWFNSAGSADADLVIDFQSEDQIALDSSFFTAQAFGVNILYDSGTGALSYDADGAGSGALSYGGDGAGSGAALLIATLQGAPAVTAEDIFII